MSNVFRRPPDFFLYLEKNQGRAVGSRHLTRVPFGAPTMPPSLAEGASAPIAFCLGV